MNNQALKDFVKAMLQEKKLSGVSDEILDRLADDLTSRLEDQINRALIDALNDEQFKTFEKLVNEEDTEKLSTFFTDNDVPVQDILTETMTKFRVAYLGS